MKTAIIGLGTIGGAVANNLVQGGMDVIIAERDPEKASAVAEKLGARATALPVSEAVQAADIIILAIWLDAIKEFLGGYRNDLGKKLVVDPSNPIAPDGKGGFKKVIPQDQSSGQIVAELLPAGAKLVKAFGTLAGTSLATAANRAPERAVLFFATDDPEAGGVVAKLIEASGFTPISVGGIDQSMRIEVFGDLHEYGKLGRLVSAREAEELLAHAPQTAHAS